jgi:hypothetical protein
MEDLLHPVGQFLVPHQPTSSPLMACGEGKVLLLWDRAISWGGDGAVAPVFGVGVAR